jgi:hypothetical protein
MVGVAGPVAFGVDAVDGSGGGARADVHVAVGGGLIRPAG